MGVKLFSKHESNHFPKIDKLAARAKEAYDSLTGETFFDLYYNFDVKEQDTSDL